MSSEILDRDSNNEPVAGFVTDDTATEIRMARIDDTTKGLKVMIVGGTGAGDVTGPATNTADYLPQWDGADSKKLKNGLAVPAGGLAGITALNLKANTADLGTAAAQNVGYFATAAQGTLADNAIPKTANITALNQTGIADGEIAVFNLTNKDIRTSDKTIVTSLGADDTTVPTSKAVKDVTDAKLALAGGTMTGKVVSSGSSEVGKTYTPATGSQTVALDCAVNNIHHVTGHADGTAITFTVANVTNSQCFIVSILQGAVVSTIAGWFATVRWAGGSAPTLTATINKRDTFGFIRTGANTYDGFVIGQNC